MPELCLGHVLYSDLILSFINFYLERGCENQVEDTSTSDRLRFDKFDICRLLKHGASLLGSAGAEFEVQDDTSGICSLNTSSCPICLAILFFHVFVKK